MVNEQKVEGLASPTDVVGNIKSAKRASHKRGNPRSHERCKSNSELVEGEGPLIEPNLTRADLSGRNLSEVNLRRAELSEANLTGADLSGTNLSEANLTRADLTDASLTEEELEPATGDENTRLPAELNPPAHWGVKTDEQAKED